MQGQITSAIFPHITGVREACGIAPVLGGLPWCRLYLDANSAASRGAAITMSLTQVISLNLLPILTGQIKARSNDCSGKEMWDWQSQRGKEEKKENGGRGARRKME